MLSAVRQDKLLRDALTVILRDHGTDVSNGIENALNEMSTAAIAASVDQLTSSDYQSRKLAAMSLRDLEPNDKDAITALRGRLEDESIVVRIEMGAALLNSDDQDRAAISVLANALTHPDNWIRSESSASFKPRPDTRFRV